MDTTIEIPRKEKEYLESDYYAVGWQNGLTWVIMHGMKICNTQQIFM